MKIVVGGSMTFAGDQLKAKEVLEQMGHDVSISEDLDVYVEDPRVKDDFDKELKHCLETDIIRDFFNKIKEADAYLIINKEKRGVRGYLGTSVLMEMGVAYHLGKKIFLLEGVGREQSYALEVEVINPVVLGGDLSKVGRSEKSSFGGMKIVVCGSSFFRDEMIENKKKLVEMGHEGVVHPDYEAFKQETWNLVRSEHAKVKKENNYIKWYYDAIVGADAILVLNYDKNGIRNYIGGNTLMEIAFAHTHGKKIFLMNPVPKEVSYYDEIEAMYDEVLSGDLSKIGGSEKGPLEGMKVSVCASVNFSDRIKEVVEDLNGRGCEVEIPFYTQKIIDGEVDLEEYKRVKAEKGDVAFREDAGVDLIKRHFDNIKNTDAILVLNYEKNGLAGYIGGNTFLEMGFAHVLGKKIYVLNELPRMGYSDELLSMGVTVLNGDLSKIVKVKGDSEMTLKIVLATGSPYRQAVFRDAGFEFEARASDIDEKFEGRPTEPSELVRRLARLKAESVAKDFNEGIIIGFDSMGYFDGEILEKPKSREEAFERLRKLSGGFYSFFTGVYMIDVSTGKELTRSVETKVLMRSLSDKEINSYLDSDKQQLYKTYAQGFDPMKGLSSTFIKSINGSCLNILQGIPLEVVTEMLENLK